MPSKEEIITLLIIAFIIILIAVIIKKIKKRKLDSLIEKRGAIGESEVNHHLYRLLRDDEYLLTNVLLPLRSGHKTEIDSIVISHKGVFCIEIKNWIGTIIGSDSKANWIQIYDNPKMGKRKHPNPVMQNEKHCINLKKIIKKKIEIHNVVIFNDLNKSSELKSEHAFSMKEFISYYKKLKNDTLSTRETNKIFDILSEYEGSRRELKAHKRDLKKRNRK